MPIARPALLLVVLAIACRADAEGVSRNAGVENYLAGYSKEYQRLNYASALAEWESNTHIVEGDSSNALRETTGRELDGKAMVEYFEPLYQWLRQQNQGRKATLPDL